MAINSRFTINSNFSFHGHIIKAKRNFKKQLNIFIITAISIISIILEIKHNETFLKYKKVAAYNMTYTNRVYFKIRDLFKNTFSVINQNSTLLIENNNLKRVNTQLIYELQLTRKLEQENKNLKELLHMPNFKRTKKEGVRILGTKQDSSGPLLIGETTTKPCMNCIVIVESGLLGKIDHINNNIITIMPILNKNFRLPIITEQSKERAILIGGKQPELLYLEEHNEIKNNEAIVTDGDNDSIIDGIAIGSVNIKNDRYFVQYNNIKNGQHKFAIMLVPILKNNR